MQSAHPPVRIERRTLPQRNVPKRDRGTKADQLSERAVLQSAGTTVTMRAFYSRCAKHRHTQRSACTKAARM